MSAPVSRPWPSNRPAPERLEQRISVERDGRVIARSGKVEYGQGIRTGFARIMAEELSVPIDRIEIVLGETDCVPWDMGTVGSMSTATDGQRLRAAAVLARTLLLERAGRRLGLASSTLALAEGRVIAPDGRVATYGELVSDEPLTGDIPEDIDAGDVPIHEPVDRPLRLEARAIVTGSAKYPADVRLPGMLRGRVLRPPRSGMRLASLDASRARALPGVAGIVHDGDFVGIVAEREEAATAALHALKAVWAPHPGVRVKPYGAVMRQDEGVEAAMSGATLHLKAAYHVPHITHASILPRAAVADVREDSADLYVATQRPFGLRDQVAALLGLPAEKVHVHPQMMGGMYGRGNAEDAAIEAIRLSCAAGRPVLVQWDRAEEFRFSPHRPYLEAEVEAGLDANGGVTGRRYAMETNFHLSGPYSMAPGVPEMSAGRNAEPPYRLGRAEIRLHVEAAAVPTISFRSLGAAPNVFAIESFMDELSHASDQDPIDFRLRLVDDPRLRQVLETVRVRSAWGAPRGNGHGLGVACAVYHGTYIAEVAEVSVGSGGAVRLERVWCAVDAGRLVHPDGARNQIEGGVQQAASWTLQEKLEVRDGPAAPISWRDYRIATFHDAPRTIEVVFTGDPTAASTGVGEPGSVPTAAAIANAVFAACGKRVRRLPIATAMA